MVIPLRASPHALLLAVGVGLTLGSQGAPPTSPLPAPGPRAAPPPPGAARELFRTSDRCLACHRGVSTSAGVDVSIGYDWRASMMANSARDPYWQAAVRREVTDRPEAAAEIEAQCSRCHMPMASVVADAEGRARSVFANLPVGEAEGAEALLAADGVSCSVCHQIAPATLGTEASFTGGFEISAETPADGRPVYGPFEPDEGGAGIMHSATGLRPTEGPHVQSPELCATCHTLFTHAILPGGEGPEFPEQTPYLEWRSSAYAAEGITCQDCHMPAVGEDVPVTGVLGLPRPEVSRHVFRGGNFFVQRMLGRYRQELGVAALPQELELAATRTEDHLRQSTAGLVVEASRSGGRLLAVVEVHNESGHKLPTAYPARRAWLHVTVSDARGRRVFESGAFQPDGSIVGNDNDLDPLRYEPHHDEITDPGQVQIYEAVMVDAASRVTTSLMSADRWVKENRLLPYGFSAQDGGRTTVVGAAASDPSFGPGADRVRYAVDVDPAAGPFTVDAELWFQPIGYRWAENLGAYDAPETRRFVRYYREMAAGSAIAIARATARDR